MSMYSSLLSTWYSPPRAVESASPLSTSTSATPSPSTAPVLPADNPEPEQLEQPEQSEQAEQFEQAKKLPPEEIVAEQEQTRAQEFAAVGLDYYAGKAFKKEGGKVWQPRYEGDQWTNKR
jgi:hypothetical protein